MLNGFNVGWFLVVKALIVSWVVDWHVVERFMVDWFLVYIFLIGRFLVDNVDWFM
jgi:hypothetical protein